MKILIMSDSHGHHELIRKAIGQEAPIDMLIHAGDIEGNLKQILGSKREYEVFAVAGNMDWYNELEDEILVSAGDHLILLTHGHRYGVHSGTKRLTARARKLGADIAVYGHTHVPDFRTEDNVMVVNPGSIAKPRQDGWKKTYAVMTVSRKGEVDVKFKSLPRLPFFDI